MIMRFLANPDGDSILDIQRLNVVTVQGKLIRLMADMILDQVPISSYLGGFSPFSGYKKRHFFCNGQMTVTKRKKYSNIGYTFVNRRVSSKKLGRPLLMGGTHWRGICSPSLGMLHDRPTQSFPKE